MEAPELRILVIEKWKSEDGKRVTDNSWTSECKGTSCADGSARRREMKDFYIQTRRRSGNVWLEACSPWDLLRKRCLAGHIDN